MTKLDKFHSLAQYLTKFILMKPDMILLGHEDFAIKRLLNTSKEAFQKNEE